MKKMVQKFIRAFYLFIGALLRVLNHSKPKVLIYTDSRGTEVGSLWGRYSPFNPLIWPFLLNFSTRFRLCEHRHTTILDFLVDENPDDYDLIILMCGIVDFSSRPKNNILEVYSEKSSVFHRFFSDEEMKDNLKEQTGYFYEGEGTGSLYSLKMAHDHIFPQLSKLENLVWINSNHIIPAWRGTYWKDRPDDMHRVYSYNDLLTESLDNVVDLRGWGEADIKRYTVDNIHFSSDGFRRVYNELAKITLVHQFLGSDDR